MGDYVGKVVAEECLKGSGSSRAEVGEGCLMSSRRAESGEEGLKRSCRAESGEERLKGSRRAEEADACLRESRITSGEAGTLEGCRRGKPRMHSRGAGRCRTGIALCLAVLLLGGCGRPAEEAEEESREPIVNFRAITLGNMPEGGMDEIYRQLDALTIPELNCTLRFEFIPWGNERRQLNIVTASGEYDFIPGGVFSDYRTLVYKNAFLDMNQYLDAVPALAEHYAFYDANALKKCEINGGLYGLPQFGQGGIASGGEGFFYREDLRIAWGLEEVHDLETMEAYLYRAKQDERYRDVPLVTDNRVWSSLWLLLTKGKYLEVNSSLETPLVVVEAANPYKAMNRMETPEFKEVLSYIWKWKRDGILDPDMLSRSDNEGELGKSLILEDKKPCETNNPIWSLNNHWIPALYEKHPEWEFNFFPYLDQFETYYVGSLASASVISISAKVTEPELAMKLLEKIHTDIRYYSLVAYGVEGENYNLVDGKIGFDGISSRNRFGWTAVTDDVMGYEGIPVNKKWDEEVYHALPEWSTEAGNVVKDDPLDGFSFVLSGREQAAVDRVWLQYFLPLVCGYGEDYTEALEEANERLQEAGFEQYLESIQEQLADYAAQRPDMGEVPSMALTD